MSIQFENKEAIKSFDLTDYPDEVIYKCNEKQISDSQCAQTTKSILNSVKKQNSKPNTVFIDENEGMKKFLTMKTTFKNL